MGGGGNGFGVGREERSMLGGGGLCETLGAIEVVLVVGGGGSRLAGPPSSGAWMGERNGFPISNAAFVSVPFDSGMTGSG